MSGVPVVVDTVADMQALGVRLAAVFGTGDLVVLDGPLGAGKTALVQGIGAGLGVTARVTSPTFVIARVHRGGRLPLVHVDAYRLVGSSTLADLEALDLDATLEESVTVVEWGAGVVESLAAEHLLVQISLAEETESRTVTLIPRGPSWSARVAKSPFA